MTVEPISAGWFSVAVAIVVTIPPTINAIVNIAISKKVEKKADVVAEKVAIATVQQGQILVLAEKTHTLVNSQYGIALALIVEKASRIYEISKSESDRIELEKAKEKLAEHEAKQHVVDTTQ
jgi:hypothetical protein